MGLIMNLVRARLTGEKVQCSTGVAEEGGQVIIRDMSTDIGTIQHKAWSLLKDLLEEANMLNQFFYQTAHSSHLSVEQKPACEPTQCDEVSTSDIATSKALKLEVQERKCSPTLDKDHSSDSTVPKAVPKDTSNSAVAEDDIDEMFAIITEALEGDGWDDVKYLLEDIILLINTDTGGQAEFMDLHASLVQGPSFNLLYSRLVDHLDSQFKVYYTNKEGLSTEEEDSTMTVAEVLFQALAGIACFSDCFSGGVSAPSEGAHKLSAGSKSKVMFVGTHRDLVTESEFKEKDHLLQQKIKNRVLRQRHCGICLG